MGTTLTGTTPQDTYDSLIKVTDNGPLTGSLKKLTDGLGNDSSLSLSTAAASFSGTLAVTESVQVNNELVLSTNNAAFRLYRTTGINYFDWSSGQDLAFSTVTTAGGSGRAERMRLTSTGNVGIGTTSPASLLHISQAAADTTLRIGNNSSYDQFIYFNGNNDWSLGMDYSNSNAFVLCNASTVGTNNRLVVTTAGVLQIPQGQIQFPSTQVASADPNTLDDYEEGTWTPVVRGSGTAGTYELASADATYTKIGRQVTVTAQIVISASVTGGGSGYAQITGLPFTNSKQAVGAVYTSSVNFSGNYLNVAFISSSGQNIVYFVETNDNAGASDLQISGITAGNGLVFTLTYFV